MNQINMYSWHHCHTRYRKNSPCNFNYHYAPLGGGYQGGHVSALEPDSDDIPLPITVNEFSLANSFWFTVGTLMQQGSDLNPKVKLM